MDLERELDVPELSDSETEILGPASIDRLCLRCKSMFSSLQSLRSLVSQEGYEHYNRKEAQQHADAGCSFCPELLWAFYMEEDDEDMPIHLRAAYNGTAIHSNLENISLYPSSILKMNSMVSAAAEPEVYNGQINICAPSGDSTSGFFDLHPLIYNMGGDILAKQALRLLDECQDSHDTCQRRCTPLLPNRVIDVRSSDCNPRLYVTASEQRANYTTLSYCWGGAQQLETTKATFDSMTLGIPMTYLPRTIQDAIIITRNLNIRYLWVDAICIIQDDKIDKATQIRGMGAIYKQSTLTIAAMSSETPYQGFLKTSVAQRGSLFPILLPNGTLGEIELVIPVVSERPLEKLETRAWAFQELLLSPRLLLFHQKEAFWRCQSRTNARTPLLGTSNEYASSRVYRLPNEIFCDVATGKKSPSNNLTEKEQNHIWSMIVYDYSRQHVQFEDRFHAIAGIVNELKGVWQDNYLAGCWEKSLVHHLVWYRSKGELQSEPMQRSSYDAPSWSWLSINCPVAIYGAISPDAEVIDCTVEPMHATLLEGPFRSGTLTIEGAFLIPSEIPDGIKLQELYEIMVEILDYEDYVEWANKMESEHNLYVCLDREADKASQEVLYLRLGSLNTRHGGYEADSYIGLILEKTTDERSQQCFKRIGRWEHFIKEEDIMAKWADAQRKTFHVI